MDAQVIAAYEAQKTAGGPAEQAASGPYNAELDRVIEENELASVVEEVVAAVTTTDASTFE